MLLAPEPREVESSPHSPPTSLTVKISDGGRDCGGSGKNHAVKSYGDQETLTGIADSAAGRVMGAVTDNGPFAETKEATAGTYTPPGAGPEPRPRAGVDDPGIDCEVEVRPIFGSLGTPESS